MARYARFLADARRDGDPFGCSLLVEPKLGKRRGKFGRLISRHLVYPLKVRFSTRGSIAHILDHSWADLLSYIPDGVTKVVTVHDLIPLRYPGDLHPSQMERFRSWVEHVRDADAVIAVSEYTKREVVDLLQVEPERVFVIPNGAAPLPEGAMGTTRVAAALEAFRGRLLVGSVGSTLKRKNLEVLPEALALFHERTGHEVTLVRAGDRLSPLLRSRFFSQLGGKALIELGRVSDQELEDFYAGIDCLAVPSWYEGFGLPVLEGMLRSRAVVAADTSSLPEVAGDSAIYFDPASADALADALVQLKDESVRSRLIERGLSRAAGFTWRRTVEGFYEVYRRLLS